MMFWTVFTKSQHRPKKFEGELEEVTMSELIEKLAEEARIRKW